MSDEIFLLPHGGRPKPLQLSQYASESDLQRLLADYPELLRLRLAGGDFVPWVLIQREIGVPGGQDESDRWSLDHLFIDADAIPTFVEVKRSSDTRARRSVVGQMLDYAANAAVHWPVELMRGAFEARCQSAEVNRSPDEVLLESLGLDDDDPNADSFWEKADENLRAGRIRLLFVGDHLPVELQRIIEFLNRHMPEVEVLGIELPRYAGEGKDTIVVPRVIGQSASITKPGRARYEAGEQWNEERFFDSLNSRVQDAVIRERSRALYDRLVATGHRIAWGRGKEWGSWIAILRGGATSYRLLRGSTLGSINIEFRYLVRTHAFVGRPELRDALKQQLEEALKYPIADGKERGGIADFPGEVLRDPEAIDRLLTVVEWVDQEIQRFHASSADD